MAYSLEKLRELVDYYLDEALLSDDASQVIVLCSILDDITGLKKELREKPNERKIKLWLTNTEDLPLILRVQTIIGLYRKEILGE